MAPVLELKNIDKRFGTVHALKDVSLDIFPGEALALVGENGAGKSTLMKILTGVYSKDSGEIVLEGNRVEMNSPSIAKKTGDRTGVSTGGDDPGIDCGGERFFGRKGAGRSGHDSLARTV